MPAPVGRYGATVFFLNHSPLSLYTPQPHLLIAPRRPAVKTVLLTCLLTLVACQSAPKGDAALAAAMPGAPDGLSVNEVMDDWHKAAADVDADRYLGYLAAESVFLGTDPSERWDKGQFSAYVEHYFMDLKRGWTYQPSQRQVTFSTDESIAWFDERLENAGYGVLRGSGVLNLQPEGWRIVHYSMTFAVPNAKVEEMVTLLGLAQGQPAAEETAE
ncbi:MAG: hypothetical protein ACI87O_002473 [Planctomycetota bacterium]